MYFYGRGDFFLGERGANGALLAGTRFHCPALEISTEQERLQHMNTSGVISELDLDIGIQNMPQVNFTLDSHSEQIVAMAFSGESGEVATGGTFTARPFPSGITVGQTYPIPGNVSNLDSLTITDSNGTPATLVAGTHYTADLKAGLVTFINLASFTQPFRAAGSEADAFKTVSLATLNTVEKFGRFIGVNIADPDNRIYTVDFYRMSINPANFTVKSSGNEVTSFEFSARCLRDESAPFTGSFGNYGRMLLDGQTV